MSSKIIVSIERQNRRHATVLLSKNDSEDLPDAHILTDVSPSMNPWIGPVFRFLGISLGDRAMINIDRFERLNE